MTAQCKDDKLPLMDRERDLQQPEGGFTEEEQVTHHGEGNFQAQGITVVKVQRQLETTKCIRGTAGNLE